MGLFSLLGDVVKLPISVIEDAVDVGNMQEPDNTVNNLKDIIKDIVDIVD